MAWFKKHPVLVLAVLFLLCLNILFYFWNPEDIVAHIGIQNTYVLVFILASIGGLSAVTGTVLYTAIATFAAGGSAVWLLGLTGGLGIFISDSIFFYLAKLGSRSVPKGWEQWLGPIRSFMKRYPTWLVLMFVLLYLSFLPLPNDILMIGLALGGYHYRTIAPVVLIGSISFATVTAYFGTFWIDLLHTGVLGM